jgi:hypothetical protein
MRYKEGESFEEWANRVSMYEKGVAFQRIAEGGDVEKIMTEMSKRITEKLLHPIRKALLAESAKHIEFDAEASRASYEQAMKNKSPAADHVGGEIFDKIE